jgi:hypothetical protein
MARRKVNYEGREVWGEEVEFEAEREGFNTYLLQDGTRLKLKTVVSDIVRLDLRNSEGEPIYLVKSTNIVTAIVPEVLKQKG